MDNEKIASELVGIAKRIVAAEYLSEYEGNDDWLAEEMAHELKRFFKDKNPDTGGYHSSSVYFSEETAKGELVTVQIMVSHNSDESVKFNLHMYEPEMEDPVYLDKDFEFGIDGYDDTRDVAKIIGKAAQKVLKRN